MTRAGRVGEALARAGRTVRRRVVPRPRPPIAARPAWAAWKDGDFVLARERAADLLASGQAGNEARHLLTLVDSVLGHHERAIATRESIDPGYGRLDELDEPVLYDYLHRNDVAGALAFAERRGLLRDGVLARRLTLAAERPFGVDLRGVADIPFTDDALTPFMPGFAVYLNGRPTVARLDTGGTFIHLSAEVAAAHGIDTVVAERESVGVLGRHTIRHGVADLELGRVTLHNVPVAVHDGALPTGPIAAAFGVELGPIIGTNVLERFLSTIDGPGRRLILSRRGDSAARTEHLARLGENRHETPFALWSDHLMIARGRVGAVGTANLFVDSGLVVVNAEQGQATLLAPRHALASWGVARPAQGRFAVVPGPVAIGSAARSGATAYTIPDRTWRGFGDWGGIEVAALISWGFLRHFSWTIDFEHQLYLFEEGREQPA